MINKTARSAVLAAASILGAVGAVADEHGGSFSIVAWLKYEYFYVDTADGKAFAGPSTGIAATIASTGGPFVEGTNSEVSCAVNGRQTSDGLSLESICSIKNPSGDILYAVSRRSAGDVAAGGGGEGDLQLLGGTGEIEGMTGSCPTSIDYLAGNQLVARVDCEWSR